MQHVHEQSCVRKELNKFVVTLPLCLTAFRIQAMGLP